MVLMKWLTGVGLTLALVGCGGGGSDPVPGGATPTPGGGSNVALTDLALKVQLLDESNPAAPKVTTALNVGNPLKIQAVLKEVTTKNGQVISEKLLSDHLVQFSIEQGTAVAELDPVSGSKLTEEGVAELKLKSLGKEAGAGTVRAKVIVEKEGKEITVSAGANFYTAGTAVAQPKTLSLGPIALTSGVTPVSSYGTTGVKVQVLEDGAPYATPTTVSFSTTCADGKAEITPSVTTQPGGWAEATFLDKGCAQVTDKEVTLRASIASDTEFKTFTVRAPTAGSLRFVSADPADKAILTSTSGASGRKKDATLLFQLVDQQGNGVGDVDVCFDATTYVGGLEIEGFSEGKLPSQQGSTALCGTDAISKVRYVKRTNADGTVSIKINSGTTPTPVRVRAKTLYPLTSSVPLETFSDTIAISTGLPLQRSFSLSVDKANIDGGRYDGVTAKLTVRLADEFSNPVPDGTTVNFIASGGAVCSASKGACDTVNGVCSCDFVSQERRPSDGRVVVLAYAVGMEDYDDNNGNNVYDESDGFLSRGFDLGDAYVDANKDGVPSGATINGETDIQVPYQSLTFKATGDGKRGMAHIRRSTIIYLSQDSGAGTATVVIPTASLHRQIDLRNGQKSLTPFVWLRQVDVGCGDDKPQTNIQMILDDGWGNPMAANTILAPVDVNRVSPGDLRPDVVLALGARSPSPDVDFLPQGNKPKVLPWTTGDHRGNVFSAHTLSLKGEPNSGGSCVGNAAFAISALSPMGAKVLTRVLYEGEPRSTDRFGVDVRYLHALQFSLPTNGMKGLPVVLTPQSWVPREGRSAKSYFIDWGDGTFSNGLVGSDGMIPAIQHTYLQAGIYQVVMSVTDDKLPVGEVYTQTRTVTVSTPAP